MVSQVEQRIGYRFRTQSLLRQALTHESASRENYEVLEFKGDAILGDVVVDELRKSAPRASVGELSRRRSRLTCNAALAAVCRRLGLTEHIVIRGRLEPKVQADVIEALIAAIDQDGGRAAAVQFIRAHILGKEKQAPLSPSRNESPRRTSFAPRRSELKPPFSFSVLDFIRGPR